MKFSSPKNIKFRMPHWTSHEFRTISEKANYDWKFILVGFMVLAIGAVVISFYVFIKVSKGEIFTVAPESNNTRTDVDTDGLERIQNHFQERKIYLDTIRTNPPKRADPSL